MTDWMRYDVPVLASFLAEDDMVSWHQVTAWQHMYEMLSEQSVRLATARAELADAWPPERSEAATTFISFIDELTASMRETSEIALTNRAALIGVLSALAQARQVIDDLHATWQAYAEMDRVAALPRVHMTPSAAPPNWSEALNAQAYRKMVETDQVIFENSRRMVAPDVLQLGGQIYPIDAIPDPGARGGTRTPTSRLINPLQVGEPSQALDDQVPTPNGASGPPAPGMQAPPPQRLSSEGDSRSVLAVDGVEAIVPTIGALIAGHTSRSTLIKSLEASSPPSRTQPTSDETSPIGGFLGSSGGSRSDSRNQKRPKKQNRVWQVHHGVSPLISSTLEETRHDPGPGIIGIDR